MPLPARSDRRPPLRLESWGKGDLPLLQRLMGDPQMMEHLGGPESAEQIVARQARFEHLAESGAGPDVQGRARGDGRGGRLDRVLAADVAG